MEIFSKQAIETKKKGSQ